MKTVEEVKAQFNSKRIYVMRRVRFNDPVIKFLADDPLSGFLFDSRLRMLPYELVEKLGVKVLEDQSEYDKYKDPPKYDVFRAEWDIHHLGYWTDRLQLLEEYQKPVGTNESPLEIFNRMSDLMIKIERRELLLRPDPKIVIQTHSRQSGDRKEYEFVRSYWINESGAKKRMIARHIGDRYQRLEKEIADLFHDRGYAVHRDYRSGKGASYDMVVELHGVKTVVEVKMVNEDIFNHLFLFDELCKRFEEDYKNTP